MRTDRIERYFDSLGKRVVLLAKKELQKAKGDTELSRSITYKVVTTADGYTLQFFMDSYGTFLDKGVSGTKTKVRFKDYTGKSLTSPYKYTTKGPPIDILSKWIKKKKIKPPKGLGRGRSKTTGQFISGFAYLISRKIKREGIPSIGFFQQPLGTALKSFAPDMLEAVKEDLINGMIETGQWTRK